MMPLNVFSPVPVRGEFLPPDDIVRPNLLVDYERGGVAIGDASQGLEVRDWECRVSGGDIQIKPMDDDTWTTITSDSSITEVALAFDQNMRPTIAYMANGVGRLYWYDSNSAAFVTSSLSGISSPVVTMDDKRAMQVSSSDVVLFYIEGGRIKHRRQRDRYGVVYDLADLPAGSTRFRRWGRTDANRLQLEMDGEEN